ncbi:MAG: hypothetical protein RQ891_01235 [Thermoflexus sp.]|jgi:hypothetical protein|uniref:AbrB/MazE/SpoVT family DNA-binding domain-containing protein n=1 Tax=Thermoflexus sp. TaxID=1969742 RepID=UPI0026159EA2|nr:hypothetical protein [Thermoflexus sp.]MDT7883463.1 hypothetical protein [Thermoflexus sp.]MDT7946944.1 hypothetical protein [Thermoflexus sp.]
MTEREMTVEAEGALILPRELLDEALLGKRVRLIVRKGEISILPEEPTDPYRTLDELAGCLGEEPFEFYDFDLEVGGFYEAR